MSKSLPGEFAVAPYVNLSVSEFVLIPEVIAPVVAVATGFPVVEVPSKKGLRVPDAWIRVWVGLRGIKSIIKLALDGEASNRVAVAMPTNPNNLKLI
jgi:hypothetical protein